jgi:hypothetical protein
MEFQIAVSILVALFVGYALGYSWRDLMHKKSAP